jgi:hypothetical protein
VIRDPFLTPEQMPQRGHTETFDARLVSPQRIRLALYFAEAAHRAARYPQRGDGRDAFETRREEVKQAVQQERWSRPIW